MTKYYYKVLSKDESNNLCSVAVRNTQYKVIYEVGKPTRGLNDTGGLFVFKELSQARVFKNDNIAAYYIYKCSVKNPRPLKYRASVYSSEIRVFWKKYNKFRSKHKKFISDINIEWECPRGTYLVSELTLVEEVS